MLNPRPTHPRAAAAWLLLAAAGPLALWAAWGTVTTCRPWGVRVAFDTFDLSVYHASSRWVCEGGALYREVHSEYPPAANLLFAAARLVGDALAPHDAPFDNFAWAWMSGCWVAYVAVLRLVATRLPRAALWLWANPTVLYFSLIRFDVYPAGLTLLALVAARRDRHLTAAVWLGLAAAVKGYPLFAVPAFAVFVWRRAGFGTGAAAAVVCGAVFAAPSAVVYSYAGWDGVAAPFRYHAVRGLDSQCSTYDVGIRWLGQEWLRAVVADPGATRGLQLAAAALAAALRPRRFQQFACAGLFALVGFASALVFYSPQFVVWLVPFAACSDSRAVRWSVLALLAATLVYFPVAFDLWHTRPDSPARERFFYGSIIVVCVLRFAVAASALVGRARAGRPRGGRPA